MKRFVLVFVSLTVVLASVGPLRSMATADASPGSAAGEQYASEDGSLPSTEQPVPSGPAAASASASASTNASASASAAVSSSPQPTASAVPQESGQKMFDGPEPVASTQAEAAIASASAPASASASDPSELSGDKAQSDSSSSSPAPQTERSTSEGQELWSDNCSEEEGGDTCGLEGVPEGYVCQKVYAGAADGRDSKLHHYECWEFSEDAGYVKGPGGIECQKVLLYDENKAFLGEGYNCVQKDTGCVYDSEWNKFACSLPADPPGGESSCADNDCGLKYAPKGYTCTEIQDLKDTDWECDPPRGETVEGPYGESCKKVYFFEHRNSKGEVFYMCNGVKETQPACDHYNFFYDADWKPLGCGYSGGKDVGTGAEGPARETKHAVQKSREDPSGGWSLLWQALGRAGAQNTDGSPPPAPDRLPTPTNEQVSEQGLDAGTESATERSSREEAKDGATKGEADSSVVFARRLLSEARSSESLREEPPTRASGADVKGPSTAAATAQSDRFLANGGLIAAMLGADDGPSGGAGSGSSGASTAGGARLGTEDAAAERGRASVEEPGVAKMAAAGGAAGRLSRALPSKALPSKDEIPFAIIGGAGVLAAGLGLALLGSREYVRHLRLRR